MGYDMLVFGDEKTLTETLENCVRLRKALGRQAFALEYGGAVLLGIGVLGELAEEGPRGDSHTFLATLHGHPEQRAIHRKVWRIQQKKEGPGLQYIRLGRSSDNDLVLPDYAISQIHCGFDRDSDGNIVIFDLDSHNGTVVNGMRLAPFQEVPLKTEDEVTLGRYLFEFLETRTFLERVENLYVMTFT